MIADVRFARPDTGAAKARPALRRGPLAAIILLALVVRVVVILVTPHFIPVTDAGEFDHIAVSLARHATYPPSYLAPHGGPTAFRPPLFPGVLAAVYEIVGTGSEHARWDAGRALEAVFGAITVWLIALIATRIWGWRVGLVAAAIAAVWPPLVMVGSSLLSESVFIPLLLAATWSALVYRDDRRLRWAAAAGVFTGLLSLTRGNGFLVIIPIGFLLWVIRPRFSRAALKAPLIAVAAAIVVVVPWTVRNYHEFHALVPLSTESGYGFAGTYNAAAQDSKHFPGAWEPPLPQIHQAFLVDHDANELQVDKTLTHEATHYIREHPGSVFTSFYWNTLRLLNLTGTGIERGLAGGEGYARWLTILSVYVMWAMIALCLLGLTRRRQLRASPLAMWGVPLTIWLTTAPLLGLTRYRSPADPFLICLAALALVGAWERLAPAREKMTHVSARRGS